MYTPKLDLKETEKAIKLVKDTFERKLAAHLNLQRVSAPRFLETGNGLQDDLAGTQIPVSFHVKHTENPVEMVHSLAKWKRMSLGRYAFPPGSGLYTDMDAIRKDEKVDDIHSVYVDQWDWEVTIRREDRNLEYLKFIVEEIYRAIIETEAVVEEHFPSLKSGLPQAISFVHCQELEDKYPNLSPYERENAAAQELGSYFLVGIGAKLKSGRVHDLRAADYDDWTTEGMPNLPGLNGDIIVFDSTRGKSLELSSMGIRVDENALQIQLKEMDQEERLEFDFHKGIMDGSTPLSIGGGIGQSRLCMLLLQKIHIGEVQVGTWPAAMIKKYEERGVTFL